MGYLRGLPPAVALRTDGAIVASRPRPRKLGRFRRGVGIAFKKGRFDHHEVRVPDVPGQAVGRFCVTKIFARSWPATNGARGLISVAFVHDDG